MGRIDDVSLAYALLRITLGLNIFMHGVSRLLAGLGNFANVMAKTFENTPVPTPSSLSSRTACRGWKA